jgi:hypothetical protein
MWGRSVLWSVLHSSIRCWASAIKVSDANVYRTLRRHGLSRLPRANRTRAVHTKRYEKQVPGHHIQVDVRFLTFAGKAGQKIRHTQENAIDFVDHIIERFPFRIQTIRTDLGHEFQAKFH